MKLRKTDPWKPASDYSRELSGLTVNLRECYIIDNSGYCWVPCEYL